MPHNLPDMLCEPLSERLSTRIGLHFSRDRWADLERGILSVSADLGFEDPTSCARHLLAIEWDRPLIEVLASHLTIGETYFFREPKTFDALSKLVLPELVRNRREAGRDIHIWSAACCSGEEAYSLAMLLDMTIPDIADWTIRILATDINPSFLRRAADGIYSEWSFRGVSDTIKRTYFTPLAGGGYGIAPRIKRMVTFSYGNLADDAEQSPRIADKSIDILFCRNVLMYFNEEVIRRVVAQFHRVLSDQGWFCPSSVEGAPMLFAPFVYAGQDGAPLYRKAATVLPAPSLAGFTASSAMAEASDPPFSTPLAPPPPASAERRADVRTPYAEAVAFHDQQRHGEAAALLLEHLESEPEHIESMLLLARVYADQGRLAEARDWCRRAIACDRLSPPSHYWLAVIQRELDEPAEALASLQRVLFLDPQFVLAHFALADLTRHLGQAAEAGRHYRNATALLEGRNAAEVLPHSDGMTVGRLLDLMRQKSPVVQGHRAQGDA